MKGIVYCILVLLAFLFWVVSPPPRPRQGFSDPPASASQMLALKAPPSNVSLFLSKMFSRFMLQNALYLPGTGEEFH